MTPRLIDSHCHFSETDVLYELNFSDSKNIADVIGKVRDKVATLRPGEWVRGERWDESKLAELRYVYAADLDKVSPNNPVWLYQSTGHYGAANSYALRLGDIDGATKDPVGGTIVFALWFAGYNLDSAHKLFDTLAHLPKPPRSFGGDLLLSGGIKLYIDGSGGARTGWMYRDWNKKSTGKDTGNAGYSTTDPQAYREMVRMFHNAGFHIGTHAIGDRGICRHPYGLTFLHHLGSTSTLPREEYWID